MAPRVLIFGTGSIGATYTYVLSRALPASNIVTVCRSNYDVASKNGFTIHSSIWGQNLKVQPIVVRTVEEAATTGNFDYVLVCSKALHTTPSIPELIKPAVSPKTTIVLIQNGIAIEQPYAELFPNNPLLSTVVYLATTQIEPGVVEHREIELLHIGSYPATSDTNSATQFAELLKSAGASTKVHEDVQFERWSKLLLNASWNPICALSRTRDAQLLAATLETKEVVRDTMLEIAAVAKACGYPRIDADLVELQMGRATVRQLPGIQPSMMADALVGNSMEVEAIVGNTIRLAKEHNVNTPMLRTIYVLAVGLDQSFARP